MFKAEYSPSSRASCRLCSEHIAQDSLRLAIMVQSRQFDGKMPKWFHYDCFWKRANCTNHQKMVGFDELRWEDQEKIKDKIEVGDIPEEVDGAETKIGYAVSYAKSNRAACRSCHNKIIKNMIRISKKDYTSQRAKKFGPQDQWYHMDCFIENRGSIGVQGDFDHNKLDDFEKLEKNDQDLLIEKLANPEKISLKRKADAESDDTDDSSSSSGSKKSKLSSNPMKKQNVYMWKIRDALSSSCSNTVMRAILTNNKQAVPSGRNKLLDRVCDGMAFGALHPCPECETGQLVMHKNSYCCSGNVTEWTKCLYTAAQPKRKQFKLPAKYQMNDFMKSYKCVVRNRLFADDKSMNDTQASGRPLKGMKFVIAGKTTKPKEVLKNDIISLWGKVVSKVDKTVAAVISSKADVEKGIKKIKDAKWADVHVVEEGFVEAARKGGAVLLIDQHCICEWGSDPESRIAAAIGGQKTRRRTWAAANEKRREAAVTQGMPTTMKVTVKGGTGIDADSGIGDKAHVYQEGEDTHSVVLGLVDVLRGTNSYYKLQVLASDIGKEYWVFRAWGRVGTTIGGNNLKSFTTCAAAVKNFKKVYLDKTGNKWEDRKYFVKHANKFYPLDIDYGSDDVEAKKLDPSAGTHSKLDPEVQDLIRIIFDVESMQQMMMEYEIDLKKMPLGRLSKKQIHLAFRVLSEVSDLVDAGASPNQFLDASNRFYTLIPHDFGLRKPMILDSKESVKSKTEMLNNLLELEIAYSLLDNSGDDGQLDALDQHYSKLNTDIHVLDKNTEEFATLTKYLTNTHGSTHSSYTLEIDEIFKLARDGEEDRFKSSIDIGNCKLLWHGSRKTNFAGILSQGLRIAPPGAPVSGTMFGKGIYFADMVSKSANYCNSKRDDPVGLMLLCEVALGNMYELDQSESITKLPDGKHSTKGRGRSFPDPAGSIETADGVEIPLGKPQNAAGSSSWRSLQYNEFIVYDAAQVCMRYLLKVKFNYE